MQTSATVSKHHSTRPNSFEFTIAPQYNEENDLVDLGSWSETVYQTANSIHLQLQRESGQDPLFRERATVFMKQLVPSYSAPVLVPKPIPVPSNAGLFPDAGTAGHVVEEEAASIPVVDKGELEKRYEATLEPFGHLFTPEALEDLAKCLRGIRFPEVVLFPREDNIGRGGTMMVYYGNLKIDGDTKAQSVRLSGPFDSKLLELLMKFYKEVPEDQVLQIPAKALKSVEKDAPPVTVDDKVEPDRAEKPKLVPKPKTVATDLKDLRNVMDSVQEVSFERMAQDLTANFVQSLNRMVADILKATNGKLPPLQQRQQGNQQGDRRYQGNNPRRDNDRRPQQQQHRPEQRSQPRQDQRPDEDRQQARSK